MIPYRAISVFYHVAMLDSVAKAAERAGVTPSAVSQQIRSLEEQIGTTLIVRSGRNIRLTEAGERYFELIAPHVEGILHSTEIIRNVRAPSILRIRATPTISTKWLLPRLGDFLDAEPGIEVHLDGSNEPVDFNRDAVDVEIRHGTGGWPGLHSEPLTEERFLPVCSPSIAPAGTLRPKNLLRHRLIRSFKAQVQWPAWFEAMHLTQPLRPRWLSFDRSHMAIEAANLGLGIALESELMIEKELRDGRLVMPVGSTATFRIRTQWIVCPRANLRRRSVLRFVEWLRRSASDWQTNSAANSLEFLKE